MSSCSFTLASNCSLIGCSDLHFYLTNSCMAGNFRKLIQRSKSVQSQNLFSPKAHGNLRSSRREYCRRGQSRPSTRNVL